MKNRLQYLVRPLLLMVLSFLLSGNLYAQDDIAFPVSFSASPSAVVCDGAFSLYFSVNDPNRNWIATVQPSQGNVFTLAEGNKAQNPIATTMTYTILTITDASNPSTVMTLSKPYVVTVTHSSTITSSNVVSNGNCAFSPVVISVQNSENGVSYQLQMVEPTASVVQTLNGNGGQLSFTGVSNPGRYVVVGSSAGCSAQMNGEVVISPAFSNAVAINGGQGCLPNAQSISTTGSQRYWDYELYRDGTATGIIQAGTGAALVFNVSTAGVYTIRATSVGCGSVSLANSFTVYPALTPFSITGTSVCMPNTTSIGVSSSESGVTYFLLLNGVVQAPLAGMAGSGGALNMGTVSAEGVYTVSARRGTCTLDMNGSVTVSAGIDKSITIQTPLTGCIGGANVITLTGSQVGVTYTLYRRGTATAIQTQTGTGSGKVTFTGISQEGEYYVRAFMAACGTMEEFAATYIIDALDGIIANREFCGNEAFTVSVSPVEAGATYTLRRGNTI